MKIETKSLIEKFISCYGEGDLVQTLSSKLDREKNFTLTVVCNRGVHAIPDLVVRGEEFTFSVGQVNLSTEVTILEEMSKLLSRLASKLKERNWRKIYIVPSGHPLFYAHAKYLIYRVSRIEAIDVVYLGDGRYADISIEHRPIIANSE